MCTYRGLTGYKNSEWWSHEGFTILLMLSTFSTMIFKVKILSIAKMQFSKYSTMHSYIDKNTLDPHVAFYLHSDNPFREILRTAPARLLALLPANDFSVLLPVLPH